MKNNIIALTPTTASRDRALALNTKSESLSFEEVKCLHSENLLRYAIVWSVAKEANETHPYFVMNETQSFGLKCLRGYLLIPMHDVSGTIHGFQLICPDGINKFNTGSCGSGLFFQISHPKQGVVILATDYPTAADIHEKTGHCVLAVFGKGNIFSVAGLIHDNRPSYRIIIALDNQLYEYFAGLVDAKVACAAQTQLSAPVSGCLNGPSTRINTFLEFKDHVRAKDLIEDAILVTSCNGSDHVDVTCKSRQTGHCDVVTDKTITADKDLPDNILVDRTIQERQEENKICKDIDPWSNPVDAAVLLTDITETIKRYIACSDTVADACSLWIAFSWFIDVVETAPLGVISAPEKRCGKTTLLSIFAKLCRRPISASNISSSALFRTMELFKPTLLLDEADAFMKKNEELRGVINSGHSRSLASTIRIIEGEPTPFSTWGAKAIAGIGKLADTIMDRAIVFELRRKLPGESKDRLRYAEQGLFETLASKLARFAIDQMGQVQNARPNLPEQLSDRSQDNWEPLLAIANVAGGVWPERALAAALAISGNSNSVHSTGTELLLSIQSIFGRKGDRIFSKDLITELCTDEESPWATYNRGKSISPRQVSTILQEYRITSRSIRIGTSKPAKGFLLEQFTDAFQRYLPPTPGGI